MAAYSSHLPDEKERLQRQIQAIDRPALAAFARADRQASERALRIDGRENQDCGGGGSGKE